MARKKKEPSDKPKKPRGPKRELVVGDNGQILARDLPLTLEEQSAKLGRITKAQQHADMAEREEERVAAELKAAKERTKAAKLAVADLIHGAPQQGDLFPATDEDMLAAHDPLDDRLPDDRPERGAADTDAA